MLCWFCGSVSAQKRFRFSAKAVPFQRKISLKAVPFQRKKRGYQQTEKMRHFKEICAKKLAIDSRKNNPQGGLWIGKLSRGIRFLVKP